MNYPKYPKLSEMEKYCLENKDTLIDFSSGVITAAFRNSSGASDEGELFATEDGVPYKIKITAVPASVLTFQCEFFTDDNPIHGVSSVFIDSINNDTVYCIMESIRDFVAKMEAVKKKNKSK